MNTTLREAYANTFRRDDVLKKAKKARAILRLRKIHPLDFVLSVVTCAIGDEERAIASARRSFLDITGFAPEESSYYDKFNSGAVELMKQLFSDALSSATREKQDALAKVLSGTGIVDVRAIDGSQITLPASAAEVLPSTSDAHGGIKLTATLSVLYQTISAVIVTNARIHDRKALKIPRWLHGTLLLLDRGYADHRLYASIEDRKGCFITPLKSRTFPTIVAIRRGLGQCHIGKALDGTLPYQSIVDVDAEFKVRRQGRRIFRVVGVNVPTISPSGKLEWTMLWFVTNLPSSSFSPEDVATLYRLRWQVESLFHILKAVGRLDQLRSANVNVIEAFLYATLLGMVLAHDTCARMRRKRPDIEPSIYRVTALLLRALPNIVRALGTRNQKKTMDAFEAALWREGVNPNPGRPYRITVYAREMAAGA